VVTKEIWFTRACESYSFILVDSLAMKGMEVPKVLDATGDLSENIGLDYYYGGSSFRSIPVFPRRPVKW
jgi:hypothetical protein